MRSATSWWLSCCTTLEYSLQANRKVLEGSQHPDRNAQFEYLNDAGAAAARGRASRRSRSMPRRKSWSAPSRTAGANCAPRASPSRCGCTTSWTRSWGGRRRMACTIWPRTRAGSPSGSTTTRPSSPSRASARWWQDAGPGGLPERDQPADHRRWGWQQRRRGSACGSWSCSGSPTRPGLELRVCHLPPGTSKWNKIEHRLFSYITQNWRGKPLVSYEVDRAA